MLCPQYVTCNNNILKHKMSVYYYVINCINWHYYHNYIRHTRKYRYIVTNSFWKKMLLINYFFQDALYKLSYWETRRIITATKCGWRQLKSLRIRKDYTTPSVTHNAFELTLSHFAIMNPPIRVNQVFTAVLKCLICCWIRLWLLCLEKLAKVLWGCKRMIKDFRIMFLANK